jgi:tripartite-type tricarboxylate transporter receptor subunit TctC
VKVLQMPDTKEKLAKEAVNPGGTTPEQFSAMIQKEMAKMATIVKAANMKVD